MEYFYVENGKQHEITNKQTNQRVLYIQCEKEI